MEPKAISAHDAQERGLAHAVRTDDYHNFAALNPKVDSLQDRPNAVMLRDVDKLNHGLFLIFLGLYLSRWFPPMR